MRRISEKLYERDPVAWFFQTIGALDMELDSRLRKEDDLVRTIQHLTEMPGKPHEPKQHFVPAAECGPKNGCNLLRTTEEREHRRNVWRTKRSDTRNKTINTT